MASIRRHGHGYEIRECRSTPQGPRQFTLARFVGTLTPEVLEEAALRARRPFDARALVARARRRGIPVSPRRRQTAARRLLAELREGHPVDPMLVSLLRQALGPMPEEPLPDHLTDAAEWVGRSESARGKALRGLLRTASRMAHSRPPKRAPRDEPFPRFSSGRAAA